MTASRAGLLQRLWSGGMWAVIGQFWLAASSLLIHWLLARLLSPSDYGAYSLLFSVANGGMVLGALGLSQALVRLVAESEGRGSPARGVQAIDRSFQFAGSFAVLLSLVAGFWGVDWLARSVFDSAPMATAAWPVAAWVLVLVFQTVTAEAFRGYHDIRSAVLFGGGLAAALSALGLAGLWIRGIELRLATVTGLVAACCALSTALGVILLYRRIHAARPAGGLERGAMRTVAWPMWVNGVTHFALAQISLWLVGIRLVEEQVALFGAAQRLVALIGMPLMVINAMTPPMIAEMYARGEKDRLERVLRFLAALAGLPALLLGGLYLLLGGPVLGFVFGDFYREAFAVLVILGAGQAVSSVAGSCGITLAMLGHQRILMVITVCCGILSLAGSLLVIGEHGIRGVAVVTAAATLLQNLLFVWQVRGRANLKTYASWSSLRDWRALIQNL